MLRQKNDENLSNNFIIVFLNKERETNKNLIGTAYERITKMKNKKKTSKTNAIKLIQHSI